MYGRETLRQKDFMKKWDLKQKKDKWNIYYN